MLSPLTYIVLRCATVIVSQSVPNATLIDLTSNPSTIQNPIQIQVGYSNFNYTPGIGAHKIHTRKVNWNRARKTCQEEGGHLVIVNSVAEAEIVAQLLVESNLDSSYVGVHDLYQEDDFVTIHGDSLAQTGFDDWLKGEPNNANNEDCVAIDVHGKMNDIPCNDHLPFVCELHESTLACATYRVSEPHRNPH